MQLAELIKLYIQQKDYHASQQKGEAADAFSQRLKQLNSELISEVKTLFAPPLSEYKAQPHIPYILFTPNNRFNDNERLPLIMHTHGGPGVYFREDQLHVEISYLLSQGFAVACPNYRGSQFLLATKEELMLEEKHSYSHMDFLGFIESHVISKNETEHAHYLRLLKWQDVARNTLHIYGPQDIIAVTQHLIRQKDIDGDNVFLRGGSFGSHINAHLLAGIKSGLYPNLYKGAHLSGGAHYPLASDMPIDIPVFISHGENDQTTPFGDAKQFMEEILIHRKIAAEDDVPSACLETFAVQHGNHHLIDPELKPNETEKGSYQELAAYLTQSTEFILKLARGETLRQTPLDVLYQRLTDLAFEDAEGQLNERATARNYIDQIASIQPSLGAAVSASACAVNVLSPSTAMLRLHNKQLSNDVNNRNEILHFLTHRFAPHDWSSEGPFTRLNESGPAIVTDHAAVEQICEMVETEQSFVSEHPDHMVLYHAAEENVLQLYTFLNVWRSVLTGDAVEELPTLTTFRFAEYMAQSFETIALFLARMTQNFDENDHCFNNVEGFADLAMACNPTLFSNSDINAASSVWWYFFSKHNSRLPLVEVVKEVMSALGLNDSSRAARYIQLFDRMSAVQHGGSQQALMQQIFVPYAEANERAYICQIWGRRFAENEIHLEKPETLRRLTRDPHAFEGLLRQHKDAFTNFRPEQYHTFGDHRAGFYYSDVLQVRYMPHQSANVVHNSYVRNSQQQRSLVRSLMKLIREDYADHLVVGCAIPRSIIKGACKITQRHRSRLRVFPSQHDAPAEDVVYRMQLRLTKRLTDNPDPSVYSAIQQLDMDAKRRIQSKLPAYNPPRGQGLVSLYQLSKAEGLTYIDLLNHWIRSTLQRSDNTRQFLIDMLKHYESGSIETIDSSDVKLINKVFSDWCHVKSSVYNTHGVNLSKPDFGLEICDALLCLANFMESAYEQNQERMARPEGFEPPTP
jgi:hypothetical protein